MATPIPMYQSSQEVTADQIKSLEPILRDAMFAEHRVTYPEQRFKHYFAPFFLGIYEVPEGQNLLMSWVSEIGSYHVEVDVVDQAGNVVFTVPPIFNTDVLSLKENAGARIRFNSLENILKEDSMNNPEGAAVNYYNGISIKLNSLLQGFSTDPHHVAKWLRIFNYYNVTPPISEDTSAITNQFAGTQPNSGVTAPVTGTGINSGWTQGAEFNFGSGL